jgi:hypothetical protein
MLRLSVLHGFRRIVALLVGLAKKHFLAPEMEHIWLRGQPDMLEIQEDLIEREICTGLPHASL